MERMIYPLFADLPLKGILNRFSLPFHNFNVEFALMSLYDSIPKIWKRAYLLLCLWYAINFTVGTIVEWNFENPHAYVFWNALYLFEALVVLIPIIFLYTRWLFKYQIYLQVIGHLAGAMVYFFVMGSLSYYLEDYLEGYVHFDQWKDHLLGLLKWEGLHFHDQYVITTGVYYVIRYF